MNKKVKSVMLQKRLPSASPRCKVFVIRRARGGTTSEDQRAHFQLARHLEEPAAKAGRERSELLQYPTRVASKSIIKVKRPTVLHVVRFRTTARITETTIVASLAAGYLARTQSERQ